MWFASPQSRDYALALEICSGCPVQLDCLTASFVEEPVMFEIHGIRGGIGASERRAALAPRIS